MSENNGSTGNKKFLKGTLILQQKIFEGHVNPYGVQHGG